MKRLITGIALFGICFGLMDGFAVGMGKSLTRIAYEQREPDAIDAMIIATREALKRNLAPNLARAVVSSESSNNQFAVSEKGAIGFMQIMPYNYKRCGLKGPSELLHPEKNVKCGVQILDEEIEAAGNVLYGLQRYNGGPKCVGRCRESINFSHKVLLVAMRDTK